MSVRNMLIGSAGARRPDPPTSVSATAGTVSQQAEVSFSAPANNGGSPITSYTVTSSPGGITASGSSSPINVTGLSNGTSYTFTVTATNAIGTSDASSPSNSVTPAQPALYTWNIGDSYTFTNLGASGAFGPSEGTINAAYSGAPFKASSNFFSAISGVNGIQRLRIPSTGTYRIAVYGARGGNSGGYSGGQGAYIQTEGPLTQGQDILIVVGHQGTDNGSSNGGGGGGSFCYLLNASGYDQYVMTDIIAAAGGGSGAQTGGSQGNGDAASTGMLGNYGVRGSDAHSTSYTRPAPGYGGFYEYVAGNGRNYGGGPGAGFFTRHSQRHNDNTSFTYKAATSGAVFNSGSDQTWSTFNSPNNSGSAFQGNSGRSGQYGTLSDFGSGMSSYSGPWTGGTGDNDQNNHGGFGGGGGGTTNCGGSGGGGGFSGGMGTGCYGTSGGGGSYGRASGDGFSGWSVTASGNHSNTNGQVVITKLS